MNNKILQMILETIIPKNYGGYSSFSEFFIKGVVIPSGKRYLLDIAHRLLGDNSYKRSSYVTSYSRNRDRTSYSAPLPEKIQKRNGNEQLIFLYENVRDAADAINDINKYIRENKFIDFNTAIGLCEKYGGDKISGPAPSWALENYGWRGVYNLKPEFLGENRWAVKFNEPSIVY